MKHPDTNECLAAKPNYFFRALVWGGVGSVCSLVILWALMFLVKPAQPAISFPLECFVTWLRETSGIFLFGGHDIPQAFFWHSVYFLFVGFVIGFALRLFIAFVSRLQDSIGQRSHDNA